MKVTVSGVVAIGLLVAAVTAGQTRAAEDTKLPGQACCMVEFRDIEALWGDFGDYASAAVGQLPPPQVFDKLLEQLAIELATFDPDVIDFNVPLRLLIPTPPLHEQTAWVFGVTDAQEYLDSLTEDFQRIDDEAGLVYRSVESETKTTTISVVGNMVVVTENADLAQAVTDAMRLGKLTPEPALGDADVMAVVDVRRLLEGLTTMLGEDPFEALRSKMQEAMDQAPPGAGPPEMVVGMLGAEIDAAEAILRQVESLQGGASVSGEAIRVQVKARVAEGDSLSTYIGSVPGGALRTLKYLPSDAMAAFAMKTGDVGAFMDWYADFLTKILGAAGQDVAAVESLIEAAKPMMALMGDEIAYSISSTSEGRMKVVEAIEVKDPEAMKESLEVLQGLFEEIAALYKAMGMEMTVEINEAVATYKGYNIAEWKFDYDFSGFPGMPEAEMQRVADMQKKMMEKMFGEEMKLHSTFVGNDWLIAMGPGSLDELSKLIDGDYEPISESEQFSAALSQMPSGYTGVGYLSLGSFVGWYLGFMQMFMPAEAQPMLAMLSGISFERGPGIMFTSQLSDNSVRCDVSVPSAEVKVVVEGFRNAFMAAAGQMEGVEEFGESEGFEEAAAGPATGEPAPDFDLAGPGGDALMLSSLRGKVVVLDFWATWCPPCQKEMPVLQKLHEQFGSRGVVIVGVNIGEEPQQVGDFARELGITFPVVLDTDGSVSTEYGIEAIPTVILVDGDGVVRGRHSGYRANIGEQLAEELEGLLSGESP